MKSLDERLQGLPVSFLAGQESPGGGLLQSSLYSISRTCGKRRHRNISEVDPQDSEPP